LKLTYLTRGGTALADYNIPTGSQAEKDGGIQAVQDTGAVPEGTAIFREIREYRDEVKDRWDIILNAVVIEFQRTLKDKWFIILTVFTWLWGILPAIALTLIQVSAGTGNRADLFSPADFYDFYQFVFVFLVMHSGYISAKHITQQKADRTITLYLCRPISKLDYLIIKFLMLVLALTLLIIVPDIILYLIVLGLLRMPFIWILEHLWVMGSILLYGFMIVTVFSLVSLAIASATKKKQWAIAGIFTFLFMSFGLAHTMREVLKNDLVMLISPWENLRQVGAPLFDTPLPYSFSWAISFVLLVAYVSISFIVLIYNINRVEVVG